MAKKANRYLEGRIAGTATAEAAAARARVAELEAELARVRATATPPAPAAPVAPPPQPSIRDQYRALQSPVAKAMFALQHQRELLALGNEDRE